MPIASNVRLLPALAVTIALFSTSAAEARSDKEELVRKWLDTMGQSGTSKIEYSDTRTDGDTVIVDNLVATTTGEDAGTVKVDRLELTGVVESADGEVSASRVEAAGIAFDSEKSTLTVEDAVFDTVAIDPKKAGTPNSPLALPHALELNTLTVSNNDGKPPLPIAALRYAADGFVGEVPTHMIITAEGISAPLDYIEEEEQRAAMRALGYSSMDITLNTELRTAPDAGEVTIEDLTIAIDDMGALALSASFAGIPPEVLRGEEGVDAPGVSEKLTQKAALQSLSISFEDDSITGKALDMQAKASGVDTDTFRTQIVAMLPQVLAAVGNKAFEAKAASAIAAFLEKPQSLTFTAAPAAPVLLSEAFAAAMLAPQSLIQTLAVDVTANE
ncbi:MAG: hypothetical protein R3D02_06045 [Hyphomicrobiales bacterium]